MPLHMELVCEDVRGFLRANLPQQIELAQTEASVVGLPPCSPLSTPQPSQYFIGEESVYRALSPPSIFLIPSRVSRPAGSLEFGGLLNQSHRFQIMCLVEGTDHESIVRACMRMAQAIDETLRDQDVTPTGITNRATKVIIPTIDFSNVLVRRTDNVFRGRVFIECQIMHFDQVAGIPIQAPSSGYGVASIGQVGVTTTVAASVTEVLLDDTDATDVLVYTTGTNAGNYRLSAYYRCTSATTLTLSVTYQDGTGTQTVVTVQGSQGAQSYAVNPLFMNVNGGVPITVTATAGNAGVVYVSVTLEKLF